MLNIFETTDVVSLVGHLNLTPFYGQGAKTEYNIGVPHFKCDKCKDIVCAKCFTDGGHREHQKYYNNSWMLQ